MGFVNKSASALMSTYEVQQTTVHSDHSAISVCMSQPVGAQVCHIARSVATKLGYQSFVEGSDKHVETADINILPSLAQGDVDGAFWHWSKCAEEALAKIPVKSGRSGNIPDSGRGHVRFQKLGRFPRRARTAHVMTLQIRRLSCALQRAEELTRMKAFGYRAERTWANLVKVLRDVPDQWHHELRAHLGQPLSIWLYAHRIFTPQLHSKVDYSKQVCEDQCLDA